MCLRCVCCVSAVCLLCVCCVLGVDVDRHRDCAHDEHNPITSSPCGCNDAADATQTVCPVNSYCWSDGGVKCTENKKDTYPEKTCGEGFVGYNGVASTCPAGFYNRDNDPDPNEGDGHKGRLMDYTTCCRQKCNDAFPNGCSNSALSISDVEIYAPKDGGAPDESQCCYWTCATSFPANGCDSQEAKKRQIRTGSWSSMCSASGCTADNCCTVGCNAWATMNPNSCPAGKQVRENDGHHCSDDNCDADECCHSQDHQDDGDEDKWDTYGKCT